MKLSIQAGSTGVTVNVFIRDVSSNFGGGLPGLVFNTAGLTAYYALPRSASVAITLVTLAAVTSAWASGGFKEIDSVGMPGWYRLDLPDAALASGRFVSIHLRGALNMVSLPLEIELTGWNNQSAVVSFDAAAVRAAVGLAAANLDTQLTTIDDFLDTEIAAILAAVDTEVAAIKTKTDFLPSATAGAANGLLISGANAGTTTLGALTVTGATTHTGATVHTGAVTMAAGLAITQSTLNARGLSITGNGNASSLYVSSSGTAIPFELYSNGSGPAFSLYSETGVGAEIIGNGGDALRLISETAHGLYAKGGANGIIGNGFQIESFAVNGDGINVVAGAGGVPIRGDITGNITGNLSGSIGSVATGGITAGSIAADAIGASELAADAVAEIQAGLATSAALVTVAATVAKLDTTIEVASGSPGEYKFTRDALEDAPTGSGSGSDPWSTLLPGSYGAGTAGKIVGDNLNATVGSRATQTSVDDVPTNAELATALGTADDAVLAQVALVKAKTDQLAFTVTNQIDSNVVAISGATESADRLERTTLAIVTGTVGSASTTTLIKTSALSPAGVDADQFKGRILIFDLNTTTAALRGQATDITANTAAGTPDLTVTALTTSPVSGDRFTVT